MSASGRGRQDRAGGGWWRALVPFVWLVASSTLAHAADVTPSAADDAAGAVQPAVHTRPAVDASAATAAARSTGALPLTTGEGGPSSRAAPLSDWRLLAAMLAAFAVLAGVRLAGRRRGATLPPDVFEVLGTAPFAGTHSVRVVRFGPRTLLVAVSTGGCTTLGEISDAEATARIAAACRSGSAFHRTRPVATPVAAAQAAGSAQTAGAARDERAGRRLAAVALAWLLCGGSAMGQAVSDRVFPAGASSQVERTSLERIDPPESVARPLEAPALPAAAAPGSADVAPRRLPGPTPDPISALPRPAARLPGDAAGDEGLAGLIAPDTIAAILPSALLFGVVSLVPAVLLMTTCFVRFSVVLMLLRQGLGTALVPSNQILASLAIFLSALVMWPVWQDCWQRGVEPYRRGTLEPAQAFAEGSLPMRRWMAVQIEAAGNRDTLQLFLSRHPSGSRDVATYDDVPLETLLPAFLVSELETAFAIGFRMLLPFLVLDLLVATLVVATGLVMLPPTLVSLPLKLVVFVAADGWTLVVRGLLDGIGMPAS